jgi:hypothetical protein
MNDRDPFIPADLTRPVNCRTQSNPLVVDLSQNTHLESAPTGDSLTMPLTLVSKPPSRSSCAGSSAGSLRAFVNQIASHTAKLSAFGATVLPISHSRNPVEAEVVSRAAGCPDLFAIHAPEQIARERIIADLAWATCSERVLVLSPDPGTADRVVERLIKLNVATARALAEDENPTRPSPVVSRATFVAHSAAYLESFNRDKAALVASAADRLSAIDTEIELRQFETRQLETLAIQHSDNEAKILEVKGLRERIEQGVRVEAQGLEITTFTTVIERTCAERQAAVDHVKRQGIDAQAALKEKEEQVASLKNLASGSGKKSGFFTRLLGRSKASADSPALVNQLHDAERDLNESALKASKLQKELENASGKLSEEREHLVSCEIASRRTGVDAQLAELMAVGVRLKSEIEALTRSIGKQRPLQELTDARSVAESESVLARQRAAKRETETRELVMQAMAELQVVVGVPGSLTADPVFESAPRDQSCDPQFSLLILDRAEELNEHDFIRLAKLATRWVLVGDLSHSEESKPHPNGKPLRNAVSGPGKRKTPSEVPFAARMAYHLDREKWAYECDHLVCRLQHIVVEHRQNIVREPLLDRPEIELRFISGTDGEPILVEVAFPMSTSIAAAKSFLFHQLGEILLRPSGEASWHSTPGTIAVSWAAVDRVTPHAEPAWIELEPGIREKVVGVGLAAFTSALAFDPASGWTVEKAERWLTEHLPAESSSRFASIARR